MEETYIVILIIAILILILYFVNFSGETNSTKQSALPPSLPQYKPYNPTEQFGSCGSQNNQLNLPTQITQITQITQTNGNKSTLKVHIAHWCGWSKKLLQQLGSDEFKNAFKDVENICVLEIIDCEANKEKCNPSIVKGFPTIILQTKSGKIVPYGGNRSTTDLIQFIKTNS